MVLPALPIDPVAAIKITYAYVNICVEGHQGVLDSYETLTQAWLQESADLQRLLYGILFAAHKHEGQVRNHRADLPYFIHPLRVALLLWKEGGIREVRLLVAALLHDTLEDTGTSIGEIFARFGKEVLGLVEELTEAPGSSLEAELHHAEQLSHGAKIIKLADRTHNLRDLLDHPPEEINSDLLNTFVSRSSQLLESLRGVHPKLENEYESAIAELQEKYLIGMIHA